MKSGMIGVTYHFLEGKIVNEIENLVKMDPIAVAEKITGQPYEDDNTTMALGMMLQMEQGAAIKEEMSLRDDSFYGSKFADALRVLDEMGFAIIHQHEYVYSSFDTDAVPDRFIVLWRDGVLAVLTSYQATTINTFNIYYNWRFNEQDGSSLFSFVASGGLNQDAYAQGEKIWVGHHDVRTGFRHTMNRLEMNGSFLSTWVERPFLWLVDTKQENEPDYDYREITDEVISTFPAEVVQAISPE